jgi:hypothetical protein
MKNKLYVKKINENKFILFTGNTRKDKFKIVYNTFDEIKKDYNQYHLIEV